MEETASTLDYAFRAKNIRNKPQMNPTISRDKLLSELTMEMEKLKSNLTAARQRNGVYMSPDTYEEMVTENESRRIINKEQKERIESMEYGLRDKTQKLLTLTNHLKNLERDNEDTRSKLNQANDALTNAQHTLTETKEKLGEESVLRTAFESTEAQLHDIGYHLLSTLDDTVQDADGLHAKLERWQGLDNDNHRTWQQSVTEVSEITEKVEARMNDFQAHHTGLLHSFSTGIDQFLKSEMTAVEESRSLLYDSLANDNVEAKNRAQLFNSKDEMEGVFDELKEIGSNVRTKVREAGNALSQVMARVSQGIMEELSRYNSQVNFSLLGHTCLC